MAGPRSAPTPTSPSSSRRTAAQQRIIDDLKLRKSKEKRAYIAVETLLEVGGVTPVVLQDALGYMQGRHYEDAVEERASRLMCGYPPCAHMLPKDDWRRGKRRIDARNRQIIDARELKRFCSRHCYAASKFVFEQLVADGEAVFGTRSRDLASVLPPADEPDANTRPKPRISASLAAAREGRSSNDSKMASAGITSTAPTITSAVSPKQSVATSAVTSAITSAAAPRPPPPLVSSTLSTLSPPVLRSPTASAAVRAAAAVEAAIAIGPAAAAKQAAAAAAGAGGVGGAVASMTKSLDTLTVIEKKPGANAKVPTPPKPVPGRSHMTIEGYDPTAGPVPQEALPRNTGASKKISAAVPIGGSSPPRRPADSTLDPWDEYDIARKAMEKLEEEKERAKKKKEEEEAAAASVVGAGGSGGVVTRGSPRQGTQTAVSAAKSGASSSSPRKTSAPVNLVSLLRTWTTAETIALFAGLDSGQEVAEEGKEQGEVAAVEAEEPPAPAMTLHAPPVSIMSKSTPAESTKKVMTNADSTDNEAERRLTAMVLPAVDGHQQMRVRRKLVSQHFDRALTSLAAGLASTSTGGNAISKSLLASHVSNAVSTFALSSHSISLKPAQWLQLAFVLVVAAAHHDSEISAQLAQKVYTKRDSISKAVRLSAKTKKEDEVEENQEGVVMTLQQAWTARLKLRQGDMDACLGILQGRPWMASS